MNRGIHGGILRKVFFAHFVACEFYRMAVQQERLLRRGHECYEPFPYPNVFTPECVACLSVAWIPNTCDSVH